MIALAFVVINAQAQVDMTTNEVNEFVEQKIKTIETEIDYNDTDALEAKLERVLKDNNPELENYKKVEINLFLSPFNKHENYKSICADVYKRVYTRVSEKINRKLYPISRESLTDKNLAFTFRKDKDGYSIMEFDFEDINLYLQINEKEEKIILKEYFEYSNKYLGFDSVE